MLFACFVCHYSLSLDSQKITNARSILTVNEIMKKSHIEFARILVFVLLLIFIHFIVVSRRIYNSMHKVYKVAFQLNFHDYKKNSLFMKKKYYCHNIHAGNTDHFEGL